MNRLIFSYVIKRAKVRFTYRKYTTSSYQNFSCVVFNNKRSPIDSKFWIKVVAASILFGQKKKNKENVIAMSNDGSFDDVIRNADQLYDENHYQDVYDSLIKYPDQESPEIKWREARALYSISKTITNKTERTKIIEQSYELIKSALEKDDNNFAVHKWMAIILDTHAEIGGIKSRVQQIEVVQRHMERACELNKDDATTWHMRGMFEFNLADLSWLQRKAVSAVFATPPEGSYTKALEYFEHAESIKPGFYSMNWLMLGKCYMALKNNEEAKKFIEKAANCTVLNQDDKNCKEEATKLFKKF